MDAVKLSNKALGVTDVGRAQKPLPDTQNPKLAAEQFEALLLQEMLKSMWSTVPKGELLTGSSEEGMYRDMLNEAIAKSVSEGTGIGIKDVISKDMIKLSKNK